MFRMFKINLLLLALLRVCFCDIIIDLNLFICLQLICCCSYNCYTFTFTTYFCNAWLLFCMNRSNKFCIKQSLQELQINQYSTDFARIQPFYQLPWRLFFTPVGMAFFSVALVLFHSALILSTCQYLSATCL